VPEPTPKKRLCGCSPLVLKSRAQLPQAEPSEVRCDGGEGSLQQPDDGPPVLPLIEEVRGRPPDAGSQAGDGLAGSSGLWVGCAWGYEAWAVDSHASPRSGLTHPCD
jgi:hypothetical protein